jgi:hypothetical protein
VCTSQFILEDGGITDPTDDSRACIPDSHRSCETVIPLDVASKDVKNSSLLSDTLKELDNMTATLGNSSSCLLSFKIDVI